MCTSGISCPLDYCQTLRVLVTISSRIYHRNNHRVAAKDIQRHSQQVQLLHLWTVPKLMFVACCQVLMAFVYIKNLLVIFSGLSSSLAVGKKVGKARYAHHRHWCTVVLDWRSWKMYQMRTWYWCRVVEELCLQELLQLWNSLVVHIVASMASNLREASSVRVNWPHLCTINRPYLPHYNFANNTTLPYSSPVVLDFSQALLSKFQWCHVSFLWNTKNSGFSINM